MIKNQTKTNQCFSFGPVTYDDILKKTDIPDTAKASQQSDVLKQSTNYFARYFFGSINQCISKSMFPPDLKLADETPVYPTYLKFMKDVLMIKFKFSSILFCSSISAGFEEATTHNTA